VSLGARGAVRVGPATFPERLAYDLAVDMGRGPFVQRMLTLARALGADATPDLHLTVTEAERKQARSDLGPGLFAACVIGSEWETKRLPPASWAVVLDGLLAQGLTPVLLGAPKEAPLAEEALQLTAGRERVRSFVGNSIEASLGLMAQSQVVVGGDTGLVHAARALGVPVVAFFGPTDPKVHLWEPASDVVALKLACQPCDPHGPRVCPLGHHDCLKKLPPAELLARAVERAGKPSL
jgi:heptosyltransferase-2